MTVFSPNGAPSAGASRRADRALRGRAPSKSAFLPLEGGLNLCLRHGPVLAAEK